MVKNRKHNIRGTAPPILVREPLILRLCTSFVNNLTLILKTGLVVGSVVLVHDLRVFFDEVNHPVAESVPVQVVPVEIEAADADAISEPVLSEGVLHALNCTYQDYRDSHYDECVKDQSRIYQRPEAGPDDTGYVFYDVPVLYARLNETPDWNE